MKSSDLSPRFFFGIFLFISTVLQFSSPAMANVQMNRNYRGVIDYLQFLQRNHPQTVTGFTLGVSDAGAPIYGVKIGSGPVNHLLVATHHGNEPVSTEVALNFAESLAFQPIPGETVYVIPVLNIEGYDRRRRYESVHGQDLDLNRDYPGPCGTAGPFFSKSTKALADFLEQHTIATVATLHTYHPAVVYPWGISTNDVETPYTPVFDAMAKAATKDSHYEIGYSTTVMYPADGTFEDYVFWKQGIFSLLFELGTANRPSPEELQFTVATNVSGLRSMLMMAPKTRAPNHQFNGKCSDSLRILDLHIE